MLSNGSREARRAGLKTGKPEHCWPTPCGKGGGLAAPELYRPQVWDGDGGVAQRPVRLQSVSNTKTIWLRRVVREWSSRVSGPARGRAPAGRLVSAKWGRIWVSGTSSFRPSRWLCRSRAADGEPHRRPRRRTPSSDQATVRVLWERCGNHAFRMACQAQASAGLPHLIPPTPMALTSISSPVSPARSHHGPTPRS